MSSQLTEQTARTAAHAAGDPPAAGGAPWKLVTMREIQVRLTDRNFLVSTAVTVVLLIALLGIQAFLAGRTTEHTVAVTGPAGSEVVEQASAQASPGDTVEIRAVEVADRAAGESLVEEGEADAVLTETDGTWTLVTDGSPDGQLQSLLAEVVRTQALSANAAAAGTTLQALTAGTELVTVDLSDEEQGSAGGPLVFIAGFVFAMLFYMASLMFGITIANSVVEEKQSRIIEILAAAIPVRQLLVGKVLGNTALAMGQLALFVGIGLVGLSFTEFDVALPGLTEAVLWYVPFFVLGFLALACIWAAAGALASRTEDVQSTTTPITLCLVGVFLASAYLDGQAEVIGSYVPVLSTIMMPVRILDGGVAWWEPVLALLVTLVFCGLTIVVGTRLYQRSLLHTSGRLSWRQAWMAGD